MKIIYRGDTRKISKALNYEELVQHLLKIFTISNTEEIGESLKLFYMDFDGDIISVTSQDDLVEYNDLNMQSDKRFALCSTVEEAREALSSARAAAAGALNQSDMLN